MGFLSDMNAKIEQAKQKAQEVKIRALEPVNGTKALATGFAITFKHYAEQQTKIKPVRHGTVSRKRSASSSRVRAGGTS